MALTAAEMTEAIKVAIKPLEDKLDGLKTQVEDLRIHVQGNTKALKDVQGTLSVSVVQAKNSRLSPSDCPTPLPLPQGALLLEYPQSLCQLMVGGAELIPGDNQVSGWSRAKSLAFILAYEPDYETDEGAGSDNEAKRARSSRRRRHKVADMLGYSRAQCAGAAQLESLLPV